MGKGSAVDLEKKSGKANESLVIWKKNCKDKVMHLNSWLLVQNES